MPIDWQRVETTVAPSGICSMARCLAEASLMMDDAVMLPAQTGPAARGNESATIRQAPLRALRGVTADFMMHITGQSL
jgi:hypothetical protein